MAPNSQIGAQKHKRKIPNTIDKNNQKGNVDETAIKKAEESTKQKDSWLKRVSKTAMKLTETLQQLVRPHALYTTRDVLDVAAADQHEAANAFHLTHLAL